MGYLSLFLICVWLPCHAQLTFVKSPTLAAEAIAAQTDPAKLATADAAGEKPEAVLDEAAKINGTAGTPYAGFVRWGLLRNLKIAHELGLLTPENMEELRRGKSATITAGPYAGQEAEADHVIPRAVAPELQNQVMNLELLPAKLNRMKSDKVGERALTFGKELHEAKLLSDAGWDAVSARSGRDTTP